MCFLSGFVHPSWDGMLNHDFIHKIKKIEKEIESKPVAGEYSFFSEKKKCHAFSCFGSLKDQMCDCWDGTLCIQFYR